MKSKILLVVLFLPWLSFAGGQEIYSENCEKCHGFSQQGSLGLPLYRSTVANHSDSYLKKTIEYGRPGRIMPGFKLSNAQTVKLIRFLRAGVKAPQYSKEPIVGDVEAGKYTYEQYCQRCHGKQLQGGEGTGKNFSWQKDRDVSPPALSNQGFLHAAEDQMIKHIIMKGIKDTEMMSFEKEFNFTDQMANDLVAYIRSHQQSSVFSDTPKAVEDEEPLVFVYQSQHDLNTTVEKLRDSAAAYNFRVYPTRTLFEGLGDATEDNKKQMVVRFCNFKNMQKFLKLDPRLGVILPCRATVVENNQGEVHIYLENYVHAIKRFNNEQISIDAKDLIDSMKEMVEEAVW
ncbi:c-type cytochrome [uncultured Candidatus Thioglobus sp.]|uniref:c-type cytochrome n=1 Tax=uncultured Candidatus Thioglobus sp. TaxID=655186 RepID=UPI001E0E936E|nr:c-type cytochrome [Candidatus Thioglobus sp.]MBT4000630.1 c-type cytochrome [Candidatus Thioglobus sp.]MBT4182362.1 c-type cytochrome [Candidatus Thioglobus sp.]MBT5165077.1 c-type cytochrome [Candidatus Thioglobus sp.]MBT6278875.1 c-type cytochrome [Candidatus Thioglobus sp.]